MKTICTKWLCSLVFSLACAGVALGTDEGSQDLHIQAIKGQALELNRDLLLLEEELQFPIESRVTVYLSLGVKDFSPLEAITLSIDGNQAAHYQYTPQQLDALRRGGAHRLYRGNVTQGGHEVVAEFTGRDPEGRDYRGKTELILVRTSGASDLELTIIDPTGLRQPEFSVKEW